MANPHARARSSPSRTALAAGCASLVFVQAVASAAPSSTTPHGFVRDPKTSEPERLAFSADQVVALRKQGIDLFRVDLYYPSTEGYYPPGEWHEEDTAAIDDRYFTSAARDRLWPCVAEAYGFAFVEGPAAIHNIVRNCMQGVWSQVGDPCLKPATRPELCTDLGYLSSWCGRKDLPANVNGNWTCASRITSAVAAAGPATVDVALPIDTESATGTTRHYLERQPGWRYHNPTDYYEWDAYVPLDSLEFRLLRGPSTLVPPPAAGITPPLTTTTTTPPPVFTVVAPGVDLRVSPMFSATQAVGTCAEYAVEKYYEFVQLDDWERANAPTSKQIYDVVYRGNGTLGPFMTTAGDFDFRDRGNVPSCNPAAPSTCQLDRGASDGSLGYELWTSGGQTTTFKNAYAFIRQVLAIDAQTTLSWSQRHAAHDALGTHYVVDDRWHKRMGDALASHLPDHLEDLRQHQRTLWEVFRGYEIDRGYLETLELSVPCGPGWHPQHPGEICSTADKIATANARLAASRAQVTAAIADETLLCPATGPLGETPCDWAPSRAVEAVHRTFESRLRGAYMTCVRRQLEGSLIEADLEADFLHPELGVPGTYTSSGAQCPIASSWDPALTPLTSAQRTDCQNDCPLDDNATPPASLDGPALAACRVLFTAADPRRTPAALEQHWHDHDVYLDALVRALVESIGKTQANGTTAYEKTTGNSYFGVSTKSLVNGGIGDQFFAHVCDRGPYQETAQAVQIGIFGANPFELADSIHEANHNHQFGQYLSGYSSDPAFDDLEAGWEPNTEVNSSLVDGDASYESSMRVGGNIISSPYGSGASINASIPLFDFSLSAGVTAYVASGPFMLFIKAGASMGISGSGYVRASSFIGTDAGHAGCNGFDHRLANGINAEAEASAFVAAGVSVGVPGLSVDVGIRGKLTLIDLSIGIGSAMTYKADVTTFNKKTARAAVELNAEGSFNLLSGTLSIFVDVTIVFIPVPVAELVLVQWNGPRESFSSAVELGTAGTGSAGYSVSDWCLVQNIKTLAARSTRRNDGGCPCLPWDDEPQCQADQEGS